MKKALYNFLFLLVTTTLFLSCSQHQNFLYAEKQATLIESMREKIFYEYSAPLNDAMKIYIELELANDPEIALPMEKILETEQKIKLERPFPGCYYLETEVASAGKKLFVIMEWNAKTGVIIRFFTNSDYIVDKLPPVTY